MMTLTDFLLARIAEDEAAAKACAYSDSMHWTANVGYLSDVEGLYIGNHQSEDYSNMNDEAAVHVARWDPARVLAECAAKKAIVDLHAPQPGYRRLQIWEKGFPGGEYVRDVCPACYHRDEDDNAENAHAPCATVRLLALPYRDHPDYQQQWAPVSDPA